MNQFTNSTSKSSKHATFSLLGHIRSKTETDLKEKLFNTHPHCVPKKQKKTKIMQKNLKLINLLQFPYYRGKIYYIKKKITIGKKFNIKIYDRKKKSCSEYIYEKSGEFTNSTPKSSNYVTFSLLGHIKTAKQTDLNENFLRPTHIVSKK